MALRELLLSLGVQVDKSGVANADAALGKLKKAAIVAAGAFAALKAAKGIANLVDGVRAMGDELDKTSKQIGISVEALQELRFAAELSGVGNQEFSNSLGRLQKNAFEAGKGNKKLAEDFALLGIKVKDSNGVLKSGEQLFTEVAEGMSKLDNDTEKTALSMNLMGRTGKQLLPLFEEGADGIQKMRDEAQSLGGVMSQDLIDATVKLTDDQLRAQKAWQGVKNDLAQALIPIFIKFSNVMVSVAKAVRGPLKFAFQVVGNILTGFADGVEFLNEVFEGLGTAVGLLVTGLGALGLAMLIFKKKAVLAGLATAKAWILASLPFILIALLIGLMLLILEDFIAFMQGKDSVIGRLVDSVKKWIKSVGGVSAAIGKIMSKLFQTIFGLSDETTQKVSDAFWAISESVRDVFVAIGEFIGEGLAAAFIFVTEFAASFMDAITGAIDFVVEKFEALTDVIADAIGSVADFVGIGVDDSVPTNAELNKIDRDRRKRLDKEFNNRVAIFKQLEKEGFGTATLSGGKGTKFVRNVGLSGFKDEAAAKARLAELTQDINAPLTVNISAPGGDAGAIGDVAVKAIAKNRDRQLKNQHALAAPE